jgi:hypothetical protein
METTNMRSSGVDEFLLFINQSIQKSSLTRVVFAGDGTDGVMSLILDGRIESGGSNGFTLRGRGCDVTFVISGAEFERSRPKDDSVVTLRKRDPDWPFRPLWVLSLPKGAVLTVCGLPSVADLARP